MELKTKLVAETGRQDLEITREFDLPVDLLFKAHTEPVFLEKWMGTKVLKMESKSHGSYQYETKDNEGNLVFRANGTIHSLHPNQKIIRTLEIENASFGVVLEVVTFEAVSENKSKLNIHTIYESAALRDRNLQFPLAYGINMAHNRLQEILNKKD